MTKFLITASLVAIALGSVRGTSTEHTDSTQANPEVAVHIGFDATGRPIYRLPNVTIAAMRRQGC